ncbi:hypothetical protein FE634_15460 [Nocardioides dongxiaopingii]|uniref:hypothetical protein n=1 Tax=Nocardioides sp. S-1144 TaxID=2582905 RepID=UPI00110E19A8|nr:hypothetical protein [Nocardioides sp. S-1144]QCW51456.1 hypothetical protein FE634_15460 [Nocardioides sp. S-1144]
MDDADRVARERAQAQRDALATGGSDATREESNRRSALLAEIKGLTQPALDAQQAAGYPALEVVDVAGSRERERGGFKLAAFWVDDRGSALHGEDYLLGDGTIASSYAGRALVLVERWDLVSTTRLEGILKALEQLSRTNT